MATTLLTGSIPLDGTNRVQVAGPELTMAARVVLKGASAAMAGQVVVSEVTPGEGFGLSSTHPSDVGQIVYFEVVETAASRAEAEAFAAMKAAKHQEMMAQQVVWQAEAAARAAAYAAAQEAEAKAKAAGEQPPA